ncbi:diacylglycerol/lipid kinase family protein [Haloactinospora alba]|uniref:diacylglycerol/lipid kinase family protein n=1 Tax=Haloactinospora alba TaxID=405555 RepID=UPI001FEC8E2A
MLEQLGDTAELTHCSTSEELHAALDRGHTTIAVAGGDGSLGSVVNALYHRGELGDRTVGLIPMGTGNDFARSMGIPTDPVEAADILHEGTAHKLDLLVDDTGDTTVNAVHLGISADSTQKASRWKPLLGAASFPVGAILTGLTTSGYRLRVEADGETIIDTDDRVLMVGLANGRYIGGGTGVLDPKARPGDGHINLMVSRYRGLLARVTHAFRLHRGTHPADPDVYRREADTVTVSGHRYSGSSDGDLMVDVTARTWRILPGAWHFLAAPSRIEAPAPSYAHADVPRVEQAWE